MYENKTKQKKIMVGKSFWNKQIIEIHSQFTNRLIDPIQNNNNNNNDFDQWFNN